jgi:hypothetical protein
LLFLGAKPQSGRYSRPTLLSGNPPDYITYANGVMHASPLVLLTAGTVDRIGVRSGNVGSAGSVIRLGIYSDNGNLYPGALLLDAGTVSGESANSDLEITISQALTAGVYWLVVVQQGAPVTTTQLTRVRASNGYVNPLPVSFATSTLAAAGSGSGVHAFTESGVTGALPSTFTASRTELSVGSPLVYVRWV